MKIRTFFLYLYTFLLLAGGIIGYLTKGSLGSISAGSLSSLLMLLSTRQMSKGSHAAYWFARVLTATLTLFFSYRLWITDAFMPAGLMTILSALAMVSLYFRQPKPVTSKL